MSDLTDPFTQEILRSYLVSVVKEMIVTTTRTAFSTCFCHGEDFTCGMFDVDGRMVAQAQGIGVHAGALEDALEDMRRHHPVPRAGDVYVHNDPFNGGTHQADVCIGKPLFVGVQHVGFAINRGHWSDVGGMAPGGWSGTAEDATQEGLILPSLLLYRGGRLEEGVARLITRNVRLADQAWGDLQAQVASDVIAERRLQALAEKYGLEAIRVAGDAAISYSRERMRSAMAEVAGSRGSGSDFIEDDAHGGGPYSIEVDLSIMEDRILADFSGTHEQVMAPVNCTLACTKAAIVGTAIGVLDPEIPLNHGVTELIDIRAPSGSLVNPTRPAPVFGATADPVDRVMETLMRAMEKIAPDRVVAGSYSTGQNLTGGGLLSDGGEFLWYSYQAGGCGSWKGGDGNSAEWHLMSNSRNESMEAWEVRYPVRYSEFSLIADSGGVGRWRGGLGTSRRFELLADTRVSAIADHHRNGARGIDGGGPGLPNAFAVIRDGVRHELAELYDLPSPSKFANVPLRAGDELVSVQGGGGGWGDPLSRDRASVEADVEAGYVSRHAAEIDYGWREPAKEPAWAS